MHPLLKPATKAKPNRLVVTVWGANKTGKSHFCLTFPPPIHLINLDRSVEDIEWKFPKLALFRADFDMPRDTDAATCAALLLQIDEVVDTSCRELQAAGGGTLAIDTTSILWNAVQSATLIPVKEKKAGGSGTNLSDIRVSPLAYAQGNLYMGSLLRRVLQYPDVNAVFVNNCADEWVNNAPTGRIQFHGWKAIHGVSQLTLQMLSGPNGFSAKIDVCRFDPTHEGLVIPTPSYDLFKGMYLDE